jgi:peptide/nickel transport system substrate-binding protein
METTWTLRPTARWHDGAPLTTADLLFTTRVEQDRELGMPRNVVYDLIEGIDATDARTITVRWNQPYIAADTMFTYGTALPWPRHLLEKAYVDDKANLLGIPYWTDEYAGAGPYRIREWARDSHAVLRANEDYVLGRPKIDEIEVKFIPDVITMAANVLADTIDLIPGRGLDYEQGLDLREQWKGGTVLVRSHGWTPLNAQFINTSPAVVADLRFRRALLQAIDRQQLVDTFMPGSSIAHSYVSPESTEYREIEGSIVRYEHDPRAAVQAIQALGYTRGPDGFFLSSPNQKLTVSIYTTATDASQVRQTAAVAAFWEGIGVAVEQVPIPRQLTQDREYRAQFPAFELVGTGNGLLPREVRRFHSSSIPLPENGFRVAGNNSRYNNADLDRLIDRYVTTVPLRERMQALAGIVQHQTDQLPNLGLFFNMTPTPVTHRMLNVTPRSPGASAAWNAHEWDLK